MVSRVAKSVALLVVVLVLAAVSIRAIDSEEHHLLQSHGSGRAELRMRFRQRLQLSRAGAGARNINVRLDTTVTGAGAEDLTIECAEQTCGAPSGMGQVLYKLATTKHEGNLRFASGVPYYIVKKANAALHVYRVGDSDNAVGAAIFVNALTLPASVRQACVTKASENNGDACLATVYWKPLACPKDDKMIVYSVSRSANNFLVYWSNLVPGSAYGARVDISVVPGAGVSVNNIYPGPEKPFSALDLKPYIKALADTAEPFLNAKVEILTGAANLPAYGTDLNLNIASMWKYGISFYHDKLGMVPTWVMEKDALMQMLHDKTQSGSDGEKAQAVAAALTKALGDKYICLHAMAIAKMNEFPWARELSKRGDQTTEHQLALTWVASKPEAKAIDLLLANLLKAIQADTRIVPPTIPEVWTALANAPLVEKWKTHYQSEDAFNAAVVAFFKHLMVGWPVNPAVNPKDATAECGAVMQKTIVDATGQHARPILPALRKALDDATALMKQRWAQVW